MPKGFAEWCLYLFLIGMGLICASVFAHAHMKDRPDLDRWFESLKSGHGLCCSFADAEILSDVQWDIRDDGHYTVFLDGKWLLVPDDAVITIPNRYGQALVWPIRYNGLVNQIRCFLPGAGT